MLHIGHHQFTNLPTTKIDTRADTNPVEFAGRSNFTNGDQEMSMHSEGSKRCTFCAMIFFPGIKHTSHASVNRCMLTESQWPWTKERGLDTDKTVSRDEVLGYFQGSKNDGSARHGASVLHMS
jgi:hypothetical protein